MSNTYKPGWPHTLVYGERKSLNLSVTLYGSTENPAAGHIGAAATAECDDHASLARCQKVCWSFGFGEMRPYGLVLNLLRQVTDHLQMGGWTLSKQEGDFPDTAAWTADGLADTWEYELEGKKLPEGFDFPEKPAAHGYNAASGFAIRVEKSGTKPEFSFAEISVLQGHADVLATMAFGRELPLTDSH